MALTLGDLAGKLVDVELVDIQQSMKGNQQILIVTAKHEGDERKFGVVGKAAIESFLQHGEKKEDGSLIAVVPQRVLSAAAEDGKVTWLNFAY